MFYTLIELSTYLRATCENSFSLQMPWVFTHTLSLTQPLQINLTWNTGYKRLNRITIKWGTELKPTKHIVVNYNFTGRITDFFYMFLLEAVVLTGIVLGGMIRYWSQTIVLYCRLNFEFFACYKSMWHFDNYRYVSNPLSITFTFSLVKYGPYIFNWTFVVLLYNYRVRETSYIVLNLL